MKTRLPIAGMAILAALISVTNARAEAERSLAEVKAMVMERAGVRNPFSGVTREDAEQALKNVTTLDRDQWAKAWCDIGLAHEKTADERKAQGADAKELNALYSRAFSNCMMGRYPVASTPGKKEAYRNSVRMFRKAAAYFDVPLQIVEIPFKTGKLVGYLQIPRGAVKPPVVINWGGVDGWKEDRQGAVRALHRSGLATLLIDMPGTGENTTLYGDPDAARTFSAWIDYLVGQGQVDGTRIGLWGGSFGGYWAARMAYEEPDRVKAAVSQGGNAHYGFQEKWLVPAFTTGGATYLFGAASLLEARNEAMGTKSMAEFIAAAPKLSLVDLGLIDKRSAPILAVNGKLDDQAPIDDVYILMEHGNPKEARVYPKGRHMGATPGMPPSEITNMISEWLKLRLAP